MTLYTETLGTVPATHFHKFCHNHRKGCKVVQFYGYYKSGSGHMHYNDNWMKLAYFLSSQETGFEMSMLRKFDVELLIGQISYKQKADIYNVSKGYDTTKKQCSTIVKDKEPRRPPVHGYMQGSNLGSILAIMYALAKEFLDVYTLQNISSKVSSSLSMCTQSASRSSADG